MFQNTDVYYLQVTGGPIARMYTVLANVVCYHTHQKLQFFSNLFLVVQPCFGTSGARYCLQFNCCCAKLPTSFLLSYGHTSNPNLNPINNKIWGFIQHSESMRRGSTLWVAAGDCWLTWSMRRSEAELCRHCRQREEKASFQKVSYFLNSCCWQLDRPN